MSRRHRRAVSRRARHVLAALGVAFALASPVVGQPAPAPAPTAPAPVPAPAPTPTPSTVDGTEPALPLIPDPGPVDPTAPRPGSVMRQPEHLSGRPSGFWTSNRPARGGAYRWKIMAAGGLVLAISLFFVIRMLRRASRERTAQVGAR